MISPKYSIAPESRRRVETVIQSLENPDHASMLRVWLKHWWGEVVYDIDACVDTVSDDVRYRWLGTEQIGEPLDKSSREFAREMYQSMIDAKLMPGGPFDEERWAFADWGITLEAVFTSVFPGALLNGVSAQSDPTGLYLVRWPMVVILPFTPQTHLISGEIMYPGPPFHIEPADAGTVLRLLGRGPIDN